LLNRELVSKAKLCLVSVFSDIVKDCPKIRKLPKIFLRMWPLTIFNVTTRMEPLQMNW